MKIGIISDIHSNSEALKKVLEVFDNEGVEKIICCGDMIGIGINPEEVVQELMKRKSKLISVIGNHEKYLINGFPEFVHDDKRSMSSDEIENHRWNHSLLKEDSKEFLKNLKKSEMVELEGKKIYIIHYPEFYDGSYKTMIKTPTADECEELFLGIDADIYLYGHTHTRSVVVNNNKYYINPGSLGCPNNTNIAKAMILEIKDGKVEIQDLDLEYEADSIREKIQELQFPFYKGILKIFYGVEVEKE